MESFLKNRFKDLAERSYKNNQYTFTQFLSLSDISEFYEISRELSFAKYEIFGGNELCERRVIRFGDPNELGYIEEFPIVCMEIKPLNEKFSDDLNHRDFLGALMNLGIERETLGDIFVDKNRAVLFCLSTISAYIEENLTRVKHTSVMARVTDKEFVLSESAKENVVIQVASERVDAVVARVFKLSRDESVKLFREQKVFINSRLCTGNDTKISEGDRISVRGYGKFDISSRGGLSKKQKINLNISVYR